MRRSDEWHRELGRGLDAAERTAIAIMRIVLGIVLVGVLIVVGIAVVNRPPGGGTQGEYYYLAAAVVLVILWIAGQFGRLRTREGHIGDRARPDLRPLQMPTFRVSREAGELPPEQGEGFQRTVEFRFGTPPGTGSRSTGTTPDIPATGIPDPAPPELRTFTFGRSFEIPVASLPADVVPDDATLDAIALSLRLGEDLDTVCEAVQPAYRDWGMLERRAYRFLIESKLAERG